jgi:hypothetical protein
MALLYLSPSTTSTPSPKTPRRRRLKGPAHAVLRSALRVAAAGTEPDYRITEDVVGDDLIDSLGKLGGARLRVLATVFSMLIHEGGRR